MSRERLAPPVDVLADHGQTLQPIEGKSGRTIAGDWVDSIEQWIQWAGRKAQAPQLVYGRDRATEHHGVKVLPWQRIDALAAAV